MEAEDSVREYLKLAFSPDRIYRIEFVKSLSNLCHYFTKEFIIQQLIPFLTNWFDPNDKEIGELLSLQLPTIAHFTVSCLYLTPLFKALLLSESTTISHNIFSCLASFKGMIELYYLFSNFITVFYDSVRAFVPKALILIENIDYQKLIMQYLLEDSAFTVKISIVKAIPYYSYELAQFTVENLIHDSNGKIRMYIPAATNQFNFFPKTVLETLKDDHDWAVRAAAAQKSGFFPFPEYIFNDLVALFNDKAWEVKLQAIISFTNIFSTHNDKKYEQYEQYVTHLILYSFDNLMQSVLGKATLDLILVLIARGNIQPDSEECTTVLTTIIQSDSSSLWLHFFHYIFSRDPGPYAPYLALCFKPLIEKISVSKEWRDREQILSLFPKIVSVMNDMQSEQYIIEKAMILCSDEAFPVRELAADYVSSYLFRAQTKSIPEFVTHLKQSDSFRDRQVAAMIFRKLYDKTDDDEFKEVLKEQIETLKKDDFENVSVLAEQI